MSDGTGLAERMLGLPGVVVLDVQDHVGEVVVIIESTKTRSWCGSCRKRAEVHDRVTRHEEGTTLPPRAWDHLVAIRAGRP